MVGIRIPTIEVRVTSPALRSERAVSIVQGHLVDALRQTLKAGETFVRSRTPLGATGNLQQSILSTIAPPDASLFLTGAIMSSSRYVEYVEEDTIPHWAPIAPLKLWARVVLGNERLAYPVRHAIAQRGTRGQHMFARSVEDVATVANVYFEQAHAAIERDLTGESSGA
jgi:hypothetical protein